MAISDSRDWANSVARHSYQRKFVKYAEQSANYRATIKENNENRSTINAVKKSVNEFFQCSSLHGLKYFADQDITIGERIFFGFSFIAVLILSAYFISNVYLKWSASPIIISTSPLPTFTSTIPFPAITICSLNQAQKSRVENMDRNSLNYTLLMSLCAKDVEFSHVMSSYIGTWKFFRTILIEVAQPCHQMLLYCQFGSRAENCETIFNSVLTDDGLCCSFNAVDPMFLLKNFTDEDRYTRTVDDELTPIDWNPEKGYDTDLPKKFYPRIARGTGSRMGLTVILNSSSEEYYCSSTKSIGFKILVHNPAEQPKIGNFGFLVTAGRESRVSISPSYQHATPAIRSIDRRKRHCLFSDEGNLSYYQTYSRKNCELECEARILLTVCGCVLYYLPRVDPNIRICGPKDNVCTKQTQIEIESASVNLTCENCYPACYELNYDSSVTASTIAYGNFITRDDYPSELFNESLSPNKVSIVHFYYGSNSFRGTKKDVLFGFTDFLSNIGGLLGLFMGFSIFSLIEIIYFMTLRPYCAHRVRSSKNNQIKTISDNEKIVNAWIWKKDDQQKFIELNLTQKKDYTSKRNQPNILDKMCGAFKKNDEVFPYYE